MIALANDPRTDVDRTVAGFAETLLELGRGTPNSRKWVVGIFVN